jgi:hypothetical protein
MIYVILDNTTGEAGTVENIALGNFPRNSGWIDVTDFNPKPEKHWLYDGSTFTFGEAPAEDFGTKITPRALSQRLNPVIRSAIRNSVDPIVIDIREDLKLIEYADLTDPDLITSFAYLVYIELMTQAESDLAINTPVTGDEI